MAPSVHTLICLLTTLFVACYCIPIKPQSPNQGATDECYGTNCYYDDLDFTTDNVNVNFPQNLTDAILLALPNIQGSHSEMVTLLNNTQISQDKVVGLLEHCLENMETWMHTGLQSTDNLTEAVTLTLPELLSSLSETITLLNKTLISQDKEVDVLEQRLENMETPKNTGLQSTDQQIKNMTAVMNMLMSNVDKLLQNQLNAMNAELTPARDCQDFVARGIDRSGPYVITPPDGLGSFEVYCDLETGNEAWTVFQKRFDGSIDFFRNWADYESGFGDANGEYWLGLKNLHRLTSDGTKWILRIDLESFEPETAYAVYDTFQISDAASNYILSVGEYNGNAGDSLKYTDRGNHDGMPFSTSDRDNDNSGRNCAQSYKGGWWYNACLRGHLNGQYRPSGAGVTGIIWYTWKEWKSLKSTQMKMRRVQ